MVRVRRRLAVALGVSAALHVGGVLAFWLAWDRPAGRSFAEAAAPPPGSPDDERAAVRPVDVAVIEPPAGVVSLGSPLAVRAVAGDDDRAIASASAPSGAPNLDRFALRAAASSGDGPGVPALPITGRRDDEQLRVQLFNADAGYRLQRIRTGPDRTSREDVRATPHPGASPYLSSRSGTGHARTTPGGRTRGRVDGRVASLARPGLPAGGGPDDRRAARSVAGQARGQAKIGKDGEVAPGFERPAIAEGPAATDGGRRSTEVMDRTDAAMVSSELHPGPIELSHPAQPGDGTRGHGQGERPAWSPTGRGSEAVPAGDPHAPPGEDLAVATYRRRYDQYLGRLKRKVDPLWELPHDLALRLEQGDVLVSYTIRRDGSLKSVKVLKTSGWKHFDQVVVAAIRRAAPFDPLPSVFGDELEVTSRFDGANPVVR